MTKSKDNEERDWEDKADTFDGCMSSFHDSRLLVSRPCALPSGGIVTAYRNIGVLSKEEHCVLNQLHIRLLKEYYSGRIMMEFFLDA